MNNYTMTPGIPQSVPGKSGHLVSLLHFSLRCGIVKMFLWNLGICTAVIHQQDVGLAGSQRTEPHTLVLLPIPNHSNSRRLFCFVLFFAFKKAHCCHSMVKRGYTIASNFLTFQFYCSSNWEGRDLSGRMNNAGASAYFGYCQYGFANAY